MSESPSGPQAPPSRIWIDADSCPMKVEVYRIAKRRGIPVTLVANHESSRPGWVAMELVEDPGVPDAADRHILKRGESGDIVVTDDLGLARGCLERGFHVLSNRGTRFQSTGERALVERRGAEVEARETGGDRGGPVPLGRKDRSAFRRALLGLLDAVG